MTESVLLFSMTGEHQEKLSVNSAKSCVERDGKESLSGMALDGSLASGGPRKQTGLVQAVKKLKWVCSPEASANDVQINWRNRKREKLIGDDGNQWGDQWRASAQKGGRLAWKTQFAKREPGREKARVTNFCWHSWNGVTNRESINVDVREIVQLEFSVLPLCVRLQIPVTLEYCSRNFAGIEQRHSVCVQTLSPLPVSPTRHRPTFLVASKFEH